MSLSIAIFVFLVCLLLSIVSSLVLSERVDQLGTWLRLSEGLLGLLTALAADSPEISSSVTAILSGDHNLGLGIVFGSNIFNLAALLGMSAIVAGSVRARLAGLWFDGGAGLTIAVIAAFRLFGYIGNGTTIVLELSVLLPYLLISAIKPEHLARLKILPRVQAALNSIVASGTRDKRKDQTPEKPSSTDLLGVVPSLIAVVMTSIGMVDSAIVMGKHWKITGAVIGTLLLATVTGIPNMLAAIRLAKRGRGAAVVSETLNSNSVNLIAGALIPAILFGAGLLNGLAKVAILWSILMTAFALGLTSFRGGLTRLRGGLLLAVYLGFVALILIWRGNG
jgi:cation:H+ antiporter